MKDRWTPWAASPTCPYCGEEITDSPEMDLPGVTETACGACGGDVKVETEARFMFRARSSNEGTGGD